MFLSYSQIGSVANGYIRATEAERGIIFDRYSLPQVKAFGADGTRPEVVENDRALFRSNCNDTTGVLLDFSTTSSFVTFRIASVDNAMGITAPFSLFVNRRLHLKREGAGTFTVKLYGKINRVQLLYPIFGRVVLESIEIDDGATVTPTPKKGLWLCIGDSITHGMLASAPHLSYVGQICMKTPYEVINQGNAGYVFDKDIIDDFGRSPDIITIAYGINDQGRKTPAHNLADMDAFLAKLTDLYKNAKIYLLSPIWSVQMSMLEYNAHFAQMYAFFDQMAAKYPVTLIDGKNLVPHKAEYLQDGLHPNDKGFVYYGTRILKQIAPRENIIKK